MVDYEEIGRKIVEIVEDIIMDSEDEDDYNDEGDEEFEDVPEEKEDVEASQDTESSNNATIEEPKIELNEE